LTEIHDDANGVDNRLNAIQNNFKRFGWIGHNSLLYRKLGGRKSLNPGLAKTTISCPAAASSDTRFEPTKPVAPAINTFNP